MLMKLILLLFLYLSVYGSIDLKDDYVNERIQAQRDEGDDTQIQHNSESSEQVKQEPQQTSAGYIDHKQSTSQCPKDVRVITLEDECVECGTFEVSVRKNSSCSQNEVCGDKKVKNE
jgi:hypothetical protein